MPPDLLETAFGALRLSVLFTLALFLPMLLQISLLLFAGWALNGLAGFFRPLRSLLGLIGTPTHELSHAAASIVTLCGVNAIKLLSDDAGVAFVEPKRSHFIQRILVGLAPLLGGVLVLWLVAIYMIPGFEAPAISPPQLDLDSAGSLGTILRESLDYLGRFLEASFSNLSALQWDNWRTYVGLYIALSVGAGIALSSSDRRYLLQGLPAALLLSWIVFAALYLSGDVESRFLALQEWLVPHLLSFSTVATSAFILSIIGIIVLLPLALWRRLRPW
jgi:hypothetical protein